MTSKVAVITGASSGIGRASARAFAAAGYSLGLVARSSAGLEAARREAEELGSVALLVQGDVADPGVVEQLAADTEARLGPIDVWVNNAMVTVLSPAAEMTAEEFRRVTEVNYLGTVYGTLAALRRMRQRDRGTIVQVGSALAYRSIPLQSAYCASKAAIRGFTDSLRSELIHDGSSVRLTMVQLPAVNTPQFEVMRNRMPGRPQPVPPIFAPATIAEAILYAAEHPAREMVVGGSALKAILGQKVAPGLVDRYLARTGYDAQQRPEAEVAGRPDNLFEWLPGDRGSEGPFQAQSRHQSLQLWLREHPALGVVSSVALAAAGAAIAARRRALG
ncbi:MAG: SDR family oxidoreductase [Chloroflexi bacterium]|nr:MAG: SDR family oxidoreductase [Chloroflexota bacterium]